MYHEGAYNTTLLGCFQRASNQRHACAFNCEGPLQRFLLQSLFESVRNPSPSLPPRKRNSHVLFPSKNCQLPSSVHLLRICYLPPSLLVVSLLIDSSSRKEALLRVAYFFAALLDEFFLGVLGPSNGSPNSMVVYIPAEGSPFHVHSAQNMIV